MKSSERQLAILEEWETTDNNIVISAVAGSGKTTTLLQLLERCKYKTLFIAFNKSIQLEIERKMSEKNLTVGKAMTLHSIGLKAIRYTRPNVQINNNKYWNIIYQIHSENKTYRKMSSEDVPKLTYDLMEMNEVSRIILSDNISEIHDAMITMDKIINSSLKVIEKYWKIFLKKREESYLSGKLEVDFTDMIYLTVKENYFIPLDPYYLFVDEAQDLNIAQHKLLDNLLAQGTVKKWIAVGDRNQAIYGFAGANARSFDLFFAKSPNTVEMPLDICYRCATNIIKEANNVYDVMIPFKKEEGVVDEVFGVEDIKDDSLVICRNTGPLVDLYFKLIANGRRAYINGNEILGYLIKFLKPYSKSKVYDAMIEMRIKESELAENESDKGKYQHFIFSENFSNFKIIVGAMFKQSDTIEMVITRMQEIFNERDNAIQLCSIHKSKGLEADVVYILKEDLIPSKFAKSKEQLQQEKNLRYVARTRAKKELYYLNV